MKQTAVEWLAEQITTVKWKMSDVTDRNSTIEQAKAMEMEQIISAHKTATLEAGFEHSADDWANQYYNETFKSE